MPSECDFEAGESASWDQEYCAGRASWDLGLPDEHIAQMIKAGSLAPGSLLDIGCGPGNESIYLATQGFEVTGLDISPVAISLARERASKACVHCSFLVGDALHFAFKDEQFDLILDKACFHFIAPQNRPRYVENLKAALKPQGKYLLFVASELDNHIQGPYKFTKREIREIFVPPFKILSLKAVTLEHHRLKPRPYLCFMERSM